jgi:hypothetical protein
MAGKIKRHAQGRMLGKGMAMGSDEMRKRMGSKEATAEQPPRLKRKRKKGAK